jgi:hypothetical protein
MTEGDFPKRLGIPLQVEQIEADREDPEIKKRFEQELKKATASHQDAGRRRHGGDHAHAHGHAGGGDEHARHHAHEDPDHHDDHGGVMFVERDWKRRSTGKG